MSDFAAGPTAASFTRNSAQSALDALDAQGWTIFRRVSFGCRVYLAGGAAATGSASDSLVVYTPAVLPDSKGASVARHQPSKPQYGFTCEGIDSRLLVTDAKHEWCTGPCRVCILRHSSHFDVLHS